MNVVTRFAPSPTGFMHVGGVRTALYAWLFARKHGGTFILRIEDTDKEREVAGSVEHIMESLSWLGLDWDEGPDKDGPHAPYLQSERLASYRAYAERLIKDGHAYPDPYSEEEVEAFRKKAAEEKRPFLFRDHRPEAPGAWDGTRPLRFRVPVIKRYEWEDLVRGTLSAGEEALDDFILIKSDGYPTYNFAHVIDDLSMGVTHIMRGEEFISSTPKFLSLYDALGIRRPEIATMPVILAEGGNKKLGKRDGAKDILDYRAEGYLPEAMVNFLALLGWHPDGDREMLSRAELIEAFDVARLQKGGAQFDEQKLLFLNREWMRTLDDADYARRVGTATKDAGMLLRAVPLMKDRAYTFAEARTMLDTELACLFSAPNPSPEALAAKEPEDAPGLTVSALQGLLGLIEALPQGVSADAVKEAVMPAADRNPKEKGGRGAVLWPLRYALSGAEKSPDPFTLVSLLGAAESASRVRTALAILAR